MERVTGNIPKSIRIRNGKLASYSSTKDAHCHQIHTQVATLHQKIVSPSRFSDLVQVCPPGLLSALILDSLVELAD